MQTEPAHEDNWPDHPEISPIIMTPTEAAQFLRLDRTRHTPISAKRTLDYWRNRGELRGTKYARYVWYLRDELENFLRSRINTCARLASLVVSFLSVASGNYSSRTKEVTNGYRKSWCLS